MTFLHKLAQRLARMKRVPLILLALIACDVKQRPTGPENSGDVIRLDISPKTLTLLPNQKTDFVVVGLTSTGGIGSLPVRWTVTGGSISETGIAAGRHSGQYWSPSQAGRYKVIARGTSGTPADSAVIEVSTTIVSSIEVTPPSATMNVGQAVQLIATPFDGAGGVLSDRAIAWTTSNASVATVNGNGVVLAVSAGGPLTITATSEGSSGTASITVAQVPVAFVSITPGSASVAVGQVAPLTATPRDVGGNALAGRAVSWASSNAAVATVNTSGQVTGVAAGSATITAMSEGQVATAAITVTLVPVATVAVTPAPASVLVGQTIQLTAIARDGSGNPLAGRAMVWTTSNGATATVSSSGLVSGVAAGPVTITATSEGKAGTSAITVTVVPVASVTVTPATASLSLGQTVQLTATPRDAGGTALTGRVVVWTTSNAAVATVNSSGLVTALAAGPATITATSEGQSGTAVITASAPVGSPGTVANLSVATVTDTSATLSFTEVTNGAGAAASYEIRFAPGTMAWGSATSVARGTCTSPLAGITVGAVRTCTVLGLARATAYAFQLVPFRGTLNVDAVFGALSNVATATTTNTVAPVASVTLSPASATVTAPQTVQLTATLRDGAGGLLTGRVVTWGTSNGAVATVNGTGRVAGVSGGPATVTASSEGVSGTAAITVNPAPPPPPPPPPPPGGSWPNDPAGFRVMTDYGFTDQFPTVEAPLGTSGWTIIYNTGVTLVNDASAPLSPSTVGQWRYPSGFVAGSAPGTMYYLTQENVSEMYFGFWWKASNPWQLNSSNNKMVFVFCGGGGAGGQMFVSMNSSGRLRAATEFPADQRNLDANVTATLITLGQWHLIELYMNKATNTIRFWLDGVLQGEYNNVSFPVEPFGMYQFSPTWGGVGSTKTETDFYWFDHVHITRP